MAEERDHLQQHQARLAAVERYLDNLDHKSRFRTQLLSALRDPNFTAYRNTFDWKRFAREFSTPDFEPPFDLWELFYLIKPHYVHGWSAVPRNRVWWLIRLAIGVERPLVWLQQQQLEKQRGEMVRIANKLGCFAVTNVQLLLYLSRHKPRIPSRFQADGARILSLAPESPAAAWGLMCQPIRRRGYSWRVKFCEALEPMPRQVPPFEQSLQFAVETMLKRYAFEPDTILYYPNRFVSRETGRLMWRGIKVGDIERLADTTRGPMLVQGWDENGWPIGHRVAAKSS
jgi:hypothetical protein